MAVTGVAITVEYLAWDTDAQAYKTGDAGNHTLRLVADGTEATPSGTPAEVDGTNAPGLYKLALTGAENTGTVMALAGKSSTSKVVLVPVYWHNTAAAVGGAVASVTGSVGGDVAGKVLGGGTSTITGIGAWAAGAAGGAVATAAKLLSYVQSLARKTVTVDADLGSTYDPATDSLEAIRDRGDAAWTTATGFEPAGAAAAALTAYDPPTRAEATADKAAILAALPASGTGAFPVTLYVRAGSTPIQNAKVRINATGGTCVLTTDSLGAVTVNLDAGTYTAYVGTAASYTPSASYTVTVNSSGAVTAPSGGILAVTAVALPTPSSASCYALWDTETDESDVALPVSTMTVTVADLSDGGRVDATNNRFRSIMQRHTHSDSVGQWALDIPIQAFTARAALTLTKTWTDAAGDEQTETWKATLVAPTSGVQVCWSDLEPRQV